MAVGQSVAECLIVFEIDMVGTCGGRSPGIPKLRHVATEERVELDYSAVSQKSHLVLHGRDIDSRTITVELNVQEIGNRNILR